MSQYMVIEHFREGCIDAVYERFRTQGRLLPPGLIYVNSWLEAGGARCFQLMETESPQLFDEWIAQWSDLVEFDVIELGQKPV
ncbi:MAG: DUF3303 family protein [Pseudomonadota bacterium]